MLTKLFQATCREAGMIAWVQILEGPPTKIWEGDKKRPKSGAISDNFGLWSRISPKRTDKLNKRRAVAAQTARSRVNLYTHCLGTIDIPGQVVYLSRNQ